MILITGGAGYVGSHVNKFLNSRGHQTIVFDNLTRGHREFAKWGVFFQGDLGEKEDIRFCFQTNQIHAVMHFGALAYVGESMADPARYYRSNVINTLNLIETMLEFGVENIIFSSTCSTYGIPEKVPIEEDSPQRPINPYGRTKLMIEEILRDFDTAYGIKHVNLRYFNAAGADPEADIGEWHDPETHLIPLVLDAASGRREDIKIFGSDYGTPDGTCIRDYIHVTDLAAAHVLALEYLCGKHKSDSFNLGNSRGVSVREVVETSRLVTGREIRVTQAPRRPGDPPVLVGSAEKARAVLGWQQQFDDINYIIETAWRWHQKIYGGGLP